MGCDHRGHFTDVSTLSLLISCMFGPFHYQQSICVTYY